MLVASFYFVTRFYIRAESQAFRAQAIWKALRFRYRVKIYLVSRKDIPCEILERLNREYREGNCCHLP